MKNIVYKEKVCGRTVLLKERDMPYMPLGHYYLGYIEILHTDPASWRHQVETGNESFFASCNEFKGFPGGATFTGTFSDVESEEGFVGFDTILGEYTQEDCIYILKQTARMLAIRTRAVQEAIASQTVEGQGTQTNKNPKNVVLLLETFNDLSDAVSLNKDDEINKANQKIENAGAKLIAFLGRELNVSPKDVIRFTLLKTVLGEDKNNEDE